MKKVIGIIAGGDSAIRKAVEFAEDDTQQGWQDLVKYKISTKDVVIGITASKLVDRFSKPAVLMTLENNIIRGSARSAGTVNIYHILIINFLNY